MPKPFRVIFACGMRIEKPAFNYMFACGGEFDIGHDSEVVAGAIAMIRKADAGMRFFKGHQAVATA